MVPISQEEFNVPLTAVAVVFTITLWMRLLGATASGWLADRIGRKTPLMISILWYSICNFIAGFSPRFWFLLLFRPLLGIGMGASSQPGQRWEWNLNDRSRGLHGRGSARVVGYRLYAVEFSLRLAALNIRPHYRD